MWKRELLKNKIYALILIGLGALSILIEYDATFFVFTSMIGIPLFFAKENWITETNPDRKERPVASYERQIITKKRRGLFRPNGVRSH